MIHRAALALLLTACADPGPEPWSATGYVERTLPLPADVSGDEVTGLTLGGIPAVDVRVDGDTLRFLDQGGPPGEAEVVLQTAGGDVVLDPIAYAAPVDPLFDRMVAIGASYTMGLRDSAVTPLGQRTGPAIALARTAGAWLPLPLFRDGLWPPVGPTDLGAPPDCVVPPQKPILTQGVLGVFQQLGQEGLPFTGARVTPEVEVRNLAVGNYRVTHTVNGGDPTDPDRALLTYLTLPTGAEALGDPLGPSQLERLEALEPTIVVSMDLVGNDILGTAVDGAEASLDDLTPLDDLEDAVTTLFSRIDDTGAWFFVADLPPIDRIARVATSDLPDDVRDEILSTSEAINATLRRLAEPYDRIHIVDLDGFVRDLGTDGLEIGGVRYDLSVLGGLTSFDGTHLSDIGYAGLADLFRREISATTGVDLPPVDLEAVAADSPWRPEAIRAAGRDPDACR